MSLRISLFLCVYLLVFCPSAISLILFFICSSFVLHSFIHSLQELGVLQQLGLSEELGHMASVPVIAILFAANVINCVAVSKCLVVARKVFGLRSE